MKENPDYKPLSEKDTGTSRPGTALFGNDEIAPPVKGNTNGLDEDGDEDINKNADEGYDTMDENGSRQEKGTDSGERDGNEEKVGPESSPDGHEGKYFIIQKGKACCNKGTRFPNFNVTSHQKHYWNDEQGAADYLAVTEDDLTFLPPVAPFGNCGLANGYPCTYYPAGKWTRTYEKVKVMGRSLVTEISELRCATGGKITVLKHGQQSEAGKMNVDHADPREQQIYNPLMDFEKFREDINGMDEPHAW